MAAILWRGSLIRCARALGRASRTGARILGPLLVVLAAGLIALVAGVYFRVSLPYAVWPRQPALYWILGAAGAHAATLLLYHYGSAVLCGPGRVDARVRAQLGNAAGVTECLQCKLPRPARAHHCRICGTCALKMDHHCPWIANCVGHGNHRHFVLLVGYFVSGATLFLGVSVPAMRDGWLGGDDGVFAAAGDVAAWRTASVLAFILAGVMAPVLLLFLAHTLRLILRGETAIESAIHDTERLVAAMQGDVFVNAYDLGPWRNVRQFFSVRQPKDWLWLLVPWPVAPFSDGVHWVTARDLFSGSRGYDAVPLGSVTTK